MTELWLSESVCLADATQVFAWRDVLPVLLGGVGLYLIQLGMGQLQGKSAWIAAGIIGVLAGMGLVAGHATETPETWLVSAFGMLAVCGGIGLITFREPVHAALGFAVAVLAAGGIFLMVGAPFVAASMVIIYAGSTIIIFLFVLMFAQSSVPQIHNSRLSSPFLATLAGGVVLVLMSVGIGSIPRLESEPLSILRVVDLGRVMFTDYLLAVEIAGTLLLVATVGAIVIGQKRPAIGIVPVRPKKGSELKSS